MSQPYSVRLPQDLRQELEQWAASEDRELSQQLVHILRDALAKRSAKCAGSGSPTLDLPRRPIAATGHAARAESAS